MIEYNKQEIIGLLIHQFNEKIKEVQESYESARQATAEAPGAMQSHSDTSRQELGKIADQLYNRVESLNYEKEQIMTLPTHTFTKIGLGSLFGLEHVVQKFEDVYMLLLGFAGEILDYQGVEITVITPVSPLAAGLMGKSAGKKIIELNLPAGKRKYKITFVK